MQQPDWQKMALWLAILITILFTIIAILMSWQKPIADPVQRYYQRFCNKLAKTGIKREPHEGPQAFAVRASARLPAKQNDIQQITDLYRRLRYRREQGLRDQFIKAIKGFSIRR